MMVGLAPQVLVAVVMTKHRGLFAVVKEMALVLTCLRPGVEIWRLARGAQRDPGAPTDPKIAMMMGKVGERVFESIPGSVLTNVTLLHNANARSPLTLASAIVACLATAFVATSIAYNFDTDPRERHRFPAFYGHVIPHTPPASEGSAPFVGRYMGSTPASKARCFCMLFAMHAAQVLSRAVRCVLCGVRYYLRTPPTA
jgi:hypothetical protein